MSETIINGIDVSECPLFDKKIGCYHTFNGECVKDSCAVYKWLLEHKRLQEENKKLKNKNNDLIEEIASGNIDIAILQKENEKLKTENEQLKKPCLVMPKVNQLAVPIEKYEELYKTLEEIREKCLKMCNICDNIDGETYLDDCNSICEYCKIVKLIKEVTNEQK
ncbi:MAG: hypothetical protein E7373_06545 [Clostridiales bacterium]|nr:hypothetical protein [Clostridiales bacterium]